MTENEDIPKKLTRDEIDKLVEDCDGVFSEIIFENQGIAEDAFPKLLKGLKIFRDACENSRIKRSKKKKD